MIIALISDTHAADFSNIAETHVPVFLFLDLVADSETKSQ